MKSKPRTKWERPCKIQPLLKMDLCCSENLFPNPIPTCWQRLCWPETMPFSVNKVIFKCPWIIMKGCWKTRCVVGTEEYYLPKEVSVGCWNGKWKSNPHYFTTLIGWVTKCTGLTILQWIVCSAIRSGTTAVILFALLLPAPPLCSANTLWRTHCTLSASPTYLHSVTWV